MALLFGGEKMKCVTNSEEKDEISKLVEGKKDLFIDVSDKIWEFAETRFQEYKSSELLCKVLTEEGFAVNKGIADMETAFMASYGSGKPVIGILAEFDALYNLSQNAGVTEKSPLIEGGNGHGCGHNALGSGSLAAAVALKDYIKKHNIQGTICYFGCPAEEGGSGKTYMARAGAFDKLDAAITWHPGNENMVSSDRTLANIQSYFKFKGISSHAAITPYLGRSALDAVELMDVGVNYLREHIIPEARVHYAITETGGCSPNVVQDKAEVLYLIRAPKITQAKDIYERIVNIAKGAALMTGTTCEVVFDKAVSNIVLNETLSKVLYNKMVELGPVEITAEDQKFAEDIWNSLQKDEQDAAFMEMNKNVAKKLAGKRISNIIDPYEFSETLYPNSSDVGDVSWVTPTVQFSTACYALGTVMHSWQQVAQGKTNLIHKSLLLAGKVIALTALQLIENPAIIKKATDEFNERLEDKKYICPIPPEVKPAVSR